MLADDPPKLDMGPAVPGRDPADLRPAGRDHGGRRSALVLSVVGLLLLSLWAFWWGKSLAQGRLASGQQTWIPILPFLAGDFRVHIDHVARAWASGRNPYLEPCCFDCSAFPYPPMVPRLFSWVSLMDPRTSSVAWICTSAGLAMIGARASWRCRRILRLQPIPLSLVVAGALFSTPVLVLLERGQCDILILPLLLAAVGLLRSGSRPAEVSAGVLLALATWIKFYPGLLLLGLVALRRRRCLAAYVAVGAAIGLLDFGLVQRALANGRLHASLAGPGPHEVIHPLAHSISFFWEGFWVPTSLRALAQIPGTVAAVGLILPLIAWVSLRVSRDRGRDRLAYPYLLWLTAAGTFLLPYSNDYNLFFLPLAALAVWDRRDPVVVHMLMALLLLWWQPLWLPIDGKVLLVFKYGGLLAVGLSLARRAVEPVPLPVPVPVPGETPPGTLRRPHTPLGVPAA